MTTLTIARLSNQVASPDAETALAAAPLLDRATRSLPRALETLLPRALAAVGLPQAAVVGLRRLELRLRITDTMDAETVAKRWADAMLDALIAALRTASASPTASRPSQSVGGPSGQPAHDSKSITGLPDPVGSAASVQHENADMVAFADLWWAEATWVRRLASGLPPPWWEDALCALPSNACAVIAGWIERDPARAAAMLLDLLHNAPGLLPLLSPREADRLAADFSRRLRATLPATLGGDSTQTAAIPLAALPPALRRALAGIQPVRSAPFVLAAVLTHLPAWAPALARTGITQDALELVHDGLDTTQSDAATPPRDAPRREAAGVAVLQGGLLLLLRPYAESGLLAGLDGDALAAALQALGLAALRRTLAPLPLATRRSLLERDRPLLAVFAGSQPPDAPLDTVTVPEEAQRHLDALLIRAPQGVAWAPGALRAGHGDADPFGDTPDGLLARIVLRPGRLAWTRWSADLTWSPDVADIALRRAGWDIDPGWLPWIGRSLRFHYDGPDAP